MSTVSATRTATGSATCRVYRRPTLLESSAARLGAALVHWSRRRRIILSEWAERERAATLRREQLETLRNDIMGAAHSGLYVWH